MLGRNRQQRVGWLEMNKLEKRTRAPETGKLWESIYAVLGSTCTLRGEEGQAHTDPGSACTRGLPTPTRVIFALSYQARTRGAFRTAKRLLGSCRSPKWMLDGEGNRPG